MSQELWDWWEFGLTDGQRDMLIALTHQSVPRDLASIVQSTTSLPLFDLSPVTGELELARWVAVFVDARGYDVRHPEFDEGRRRQQPLRRIELLYTPACDHWQSALLRLSVALQCAGFEDAQLHTIRVDSQEAAEELRFPGSPTVRLNGQDPFPVAVGSLPSLTCRRYGSLSRSLDSPTIHELTSVLSHYEDADSRTL